MKQMLLDGLGLNQLEKEKIGIISKHHINIDSQIQRPAMLLQAYKFHEIKDRDFHLLGYSAGLEFFGEKQTYKQARGKHIHEIFKSDISNHIISHEKTVIYTNESLIYPCQIEHSVLGLLKTTRYAFPFQYAKYKTKGILTLWKLDEQISSMSFEKVFLIVNTGHVHLFLNNDGYQFKNNLMDTHLTSEDVQLILYLMFGMEYARIANYMQINSSQVNQILSDILEKMKLHSKKELITIFQKSQLLENL